MTTITPLLIDGPLTKTQASRMTTNGQKGVSSTDNGVHEQKRCRFCGSNTVPPEIALDAGLEVNFSLALSQVS
jgi:hypothetical protein